MQILLVILPDAWAVTTAVTIVFAIMSFLMLRSINRYDSDIKDLQAQVEKLQSAAAKDRLDNQVNVSSLAQNMSDKLHEVALSMTEIKTYVHTNNK